MNLTFSGFLKLYCAELSETKTTSLRKLTALANGDYPRVAEPLFCYAACIGKVDKLIEIARGTWMEEEYHAVKAKMAKYSSLEEFLKSEDAPKRYASVHQAYRGEKYGINDERRIIELMRNKTLEALKASGKSVYRLGKDLSLNTGNLYAYLKGDCTKVSRDTARMIMKHAQSYTL